MPHEIPGKIEFSKSGIAKFDMLAAHRYRASDGSRIPVIAFGTALFEMKRSQQILTLLFRFLDSQFSCRQAARQILEHKRA